MPEGGHCPVWAQQAAKVDRMLLGEGFYYFKPACFLTGSRIRDGRIEVFHVSYNQPEPSAVWQSWDVIVNSMLSVICP